MATLDTVAPSSATSPLLRFCKLSLLGLMLAMAAGLMAPTQAHPDHQQVNSGTPAAPDHEHPHQGQQPH